jgi:hypothetical protein
MSGMVWKFIKKNKQTYILYSIDYNITSSKNLNIPTVTIHSKETLISACVCLATADCIWLIPV